MKNRLLNYTQEFEDYRYKVTDLVEASKDLEVFELKVADIFTNYAAPCENTLTDFIAHCKQTKEADLSFPIILSPCNFILDGKHRVAKSIIEGKETIKAVRFREMPDCGEYVDN